MTTIHDLSGPAEALYSEALKSGDPAGYLRTADGWLPEDRRQVAEVLGVRIDRAAQPCPDAREAG